MSFVEELILPVPVRTPWSEIVNKKELAVLMVERGDYPSQAEAKKAIDCVFDCITDVVSAKTGKRNGSKNEEVKLLGFGTFRVKKVKARKGRNPQTGEEIKVPARTVVRFAPLKALKEEVDPSVRK